MSIFEKFNHPRDCVGASITGLVTFSAYFIQHLITVSSRHFAAAFDIPLYNTSIFFSKLHSSRGLSMTLGSVLFYCIAAVLRVQLKTISFISILFLFFTRILLLVTLSNRYVIQVDVYKILNLEAFFFGYFHTTLFKIVTKYPMTKALFTDFTRLLIFFIQTGLDFAFYNQPLLMIEIQCWICFIFTLIAVGCWFFYLYYFNTVFPGTDIHDTIINEFRWEPVPQTPNKFECKNFKKYSYRNTPIIRSRIRCRFSEYYSRNFSLFLMFTLSCIFKDFLFPGILPYALLERDKSHSINMAVPIFCFIAPILIYFLCRYCDGFGTKWNWLKELFWIFTIPQLGCLLFSLYIIHHKVPFFKHSSGSKFTVFGLTIILILSFSFVETLARHHYTMIPSNSSESLIMYHNVVAMFYSFLFSKLSVGYNCARVEYEYFLTPFYPTYKMNVFSSIFFWIGDVFKRAYEDISGDFRMNIQEYL